MIKRKNKINTFENQNLIRLEIMTTMDTFHTHLKEKMNDLKEKMYYRTLKCFDDIRSVKFEFLIAFDFVDLSF